MSHDQHLSDSETDATHDEPLSRYVYKRLTSERSIRLLKLHPAAKKDQEIICDLEEHKLDGDTIPEYEALSWSWGKGAWDGKIKIREGDEVFLYRMAPSLVNALVALRQKKKVRVLWVDAICINQHRAEEKNHQVPMMTDIYGKARKVCIWIGEGDKESRMAIDFIKQDVLKLQGFDELCESSEATSKWRAMLNLMKREWFERRWVVQEIALARDAELYCGTKTIAWKDFADAVQLFVEVETATHRLSDVMKKDPNFYHVPGWFEYVSALGASLLVDATGTLFRISEDKKKRQPLLSLEYLVSKLSVFRSSEPRDTIYALLAVAKDTNPIAVDYMSGYHDSDAINTMKKWLGQKSQQKKQYPVDYSLKFVDICREFIEFAIRQSSKTDPTRALDILCRPWAPSANKHASTVNSSDSDYLPNIRGGHNEILPSWIPQLEGAAFAMFQHPNYEYKMGRKNADPLVGLPYPGQKNYFAAETKEVDLNHLKFKKRDEYYSMYVSGFILDTVAKVEVASQSGNIPEEWVDAVGWTNIEEDPPESFWRTLVADRGSNGRNPPTYYGRACKESITKGLPSGALNTMELINEGRCSVVSEFFRRVQAVIWNRSLMRTTLKHHGIVRKDVIPGDLICILYGCSVPVVLRRHRKTVEVVEHERKEDLEEAKRAREEADAKRKLEAATRIQRAFRRSQRAKKAARRPPVTSASAAKSLQTVTSSKGAKSYASVAAEPSTAAQKRTKPPVKAKKPSLSSPTSSTIGESSQLLASDLPGPDADPRNSQAPEEPALSTLEAENDPDADEFFWYEFIGECYVHGMMDGEAIEYQNLNRDTTKPRVFELR